MTELVDKKVKIVTMYFICSKAKGETEQINKNYIFKKKYSNRSTRDASEIQNHTGQTTTR